MTKNKFAYPPYLPEFDGIKAARLLRTLNMLSKTCCRNTSVEGAARELTKLISRPSTIRKCDLPFLLPVVEAINQLEEVESRRMDPKTEVTLPICKMKKCELFKMEGYRVTCGFIHQGICFRKEIELD